MKAFFLPLVAVIAIVLPNCGYHLGGLKPRSMAHIDAISVATFTNDSLEPSASGLVTNSIAEAIQRDGTYKLKSRKQAGARLEGRIVSVEYTQLRSSDYDTYESSEVGLILTVEYKVFDGSNKILANGTVRNTASLFNVGNMQTSKTNALSYAARQAGQSIADNISNG